MATTRPQLPAAQSTDAPGPLSAPPDGPVVSPGWKTARRLALGIVVIYLTLMADACLVLHFGPVVAQGNATTWDRAVFTSISAATLTGFRQTIGITEMRATGMSGPGMLLGLTLAGSLMTLIVGGLAAGRILRMAHTPSQIVWAAVTSVLLTSLAGAAALGGSAVSVFDALFRSTCAFANSGLWLGHAPSTTSLSTYLVLLPLVILGGLGLPVLIELSDRFFGGPPISRHSRVVLTLTGLFYLGGFGLLMLSQISAAYHGGWPAWRNTLASCSVAAIDTRSAGIPFQSPAAYTAAGQWVLMLLMLVGAASAGTASGLKFTTLHELGRGIGSALRGRAASRAAGVAAVWLAVFVGALFVGMVLLFTSDPQIEGSHLLFLACSAIGNVGLSHDPISITGPGLFVLSFLMLVGRLGPLAILWWMAETTQNADVLVG